MHTSLLALAFVAQVVAQPQRPVIRSRADLVTTDVRVQDERGHFVADLRKDDFEVYEDGVKQDVSMFVLTHGGRVFNETPPPSAATEGLLLPVARPPGDRSGRVFLIFVDDFHIDFRLTSRVRELLHTIATDVVHDGDLFGIVSSGYSSIAIEMTYDRKPLADAAARVQGAGLPPSDVIATPHGAQGPAEVRHRAHVAFSTAYEILQKFEQIHDRRKAFIYISEGYDYDPYSRSRAKAAADRNPAPRGSAADTGQVPDTNPFSTGNNEFAAADLSAELAELTREANRANTTIYTIDPRGLVGGPDIDQTTLDSRDWQDHVRETQNSLRTIAELTGGVAVVDRNDFKAALKRIDSEMSDYYVLGYYSSNPDPLKKRRTIEIRIKPSPGKHAGKYELSSRTSYTLKPPVSRR
jgi:VWFA-related protein